MAKIASQFAGATSSALRDIRLTATDFFCMLLKRNISYVRNPISLCFHVLDLVEFMHLSLRLSKFNTMENNGFKNYYRIKI